jgi:RNA polymerase-binding transcription factor DksA
MENTEKARYSDEELVEFRDLINKKIEQTRDELNYIQDSLKQLVDSGNDDIISSSKQMEDNSIIAEKEQMNQLSERLRKHLNNLEAALVRIENKTYGICKETGKLISKERLRVVPHTTLSVEAKLKK